LHKKLFRFCLQKFGKTIGKVAGFGLNSRKSLRKAKSLLCYFSSLVIIFAFFLAENSETQSRKHERLKARNKTTFRLSCLRIWVQSGIAAGYAGYFLPFLKKGKKCQPSSMELIGLIAAKV
jgi:hypothetical protein